MTVLADVFGDNLEFLTDDQRDLLRITPAMVDLAEDLGRKLQVKVGKAKLKVSATSASLSHEDGWLPLELEHVRSPRDLCERDRSDGGVSNG